ncbi:MAG: TonB-dependent receptor, partial [Candidatus Aminicenantes bacterium]|nr:TonB-dependent receptor [Candidatus Aminicenantes bacterium]
MQRLKRVTGTWFLALCTIAFLSAPVVHGQSIIYGKLTGTITADTGETLPGVTVEVKSTALITGSRSTVTSDRGIFVFLNLPVGRYDLTASLQGFKSVVQENIGISAGSTRVIDLVLEPGAIEEEVTVIAVSPVVDAKSSTIAAYIERDLLDKLPTSRDAFYDLSLTTPGMVAQGKDGDWLPSPNAYGSTSNENIFLINGVNTTNPRAAAYGSLVKVNYDAVEEVRVIALGSKAEYGNFTGVAIDVLTKSGSNELHGNIALYSIAGKAADNQPKPVTPGAEVDLGTFGPEGESFLIGAGDSILKRARKDLEGNFTLGGPIIKDKVWFFLGADYTQAETIVPFFPVNSEWQGLFGDVKITSEPLSNHRAWLAYHYENNDTDGTTWNPHWDDTMYYGTSTVSHSISSQWQWMLTGRTIFTAKYLGFWT